MKYVGSIGEQVRAAAVHSSSRSRVRGGVALAALLFAGASLAACDVPLTELSKDRGAMRVTIDPSHIEASAALGALSSQSNLDMQPAEYRITGTGPSGASFTESSSGGESDITDIRIGEWRVEVSAFNAAEQEIGYGSATVEVKSGELAPVHITVRPLSGTGSLSLLVTWPQEELADPELTAALADAQGRSEKLGFEMPEPGKAEFWSDEIEAGYYTLTLQLIDGDQVLAGAVDAVRVVKGGRTRGEFSFDDLNHPTGEIDISVVSEMDDPLEVSITQAPSAIAYRSSVTAQAEVANAGGSEIAYRWYLNAESAGTGPTLDIGENLSPGTYRLDVVAVTADGRRSGSATHQLTVEQP